MEGPVLGPLARHRVLDGGQLHADDRLGGGLVADALAVDWVGVGLWGLGCGGVGVGGWGLGVWGAWGS